MSQPVLRPVHWPAPGGVRACVTTRHGGVSLPPFDSLNLGDHVGDSLAAVAANRAALGQALGARPVFLQQVHGTQVQRLDPTTPDATVADACVTTQPGVVCTVMVADCLPVLLTDAQGRTVAAAHAGWRGLAGVDDTAGLSGGGVLESTFKLFKALSLDVHRESAIDFESHKPSAIANTAVSAPQLAATAAAEAAWAQGCVAWLGPCIGPRAFEVGAEVRDAFMATAADPEAVSRCFEPVAGQPGKHLAHLAALARLRLAQLGVTQVHGNDSSDAWCTVAQSSVWFSHRRDTAQGGSTGRMAACVWLDGG